MNDKLKQIREWCSAAQRAIEADDLPKVMEFAQKASSCASQLHEKAKREILDRAINGNRR